jgi:hypothetical protein
MGIPSSARPRRATCSGRPTAPGHVALARCQLPELGVRPPPGPTATVTLDFADLWSEPRLVSRSRPAAGRIRAGPARTCAADPTPAIQSPHPSRRAVTRRPRRAWTRVRSRSVGRRRAPAIRSGSPRRPLLVHSGLSSERASPADCAGTVGRHSRGGHRFSTELPHGQRRLAAVLQARGRRCSVVPQFRDAQDVSWKLRFVGALDDCRLRPRPGRGGRAGAHRAS